MPKLVGLITAWGAEPFIEPAIKQGLEYCDELVVSVGLHMPHLKAYEDNTMTIAEKYKNQIKIVPSVCKGGYVSSRSLSLKKMLDDTGNNKKGNWIFILDCDEFYFPEDIARAKDVIKENNHKRIMMPEKVFMIDTKHYLKWGRDRLKKLTQDNMSFKNNLLGYENSEKPFTLPTNKGMFHYTFLLNHNAKRTFWLNEYGNSSGINEKKKVYWLDEIYLKTDLNSQATAVQKSLKKYGIKSAAGPIFHGGPWKSVDQNGHYYKYDGEHPSFIEDAGLTKIKDYRKYYG